MLTLLLLAQVPSGPGPLETAEGLSKLGLYWVVGVLCTVVVALFGYILLGHQARMADRDARDKRLDAISERHAAMSERHATQLEALALDMRNVVVENGRQLFTLARYIEESRPASRKRPPALGPESPSQVRPEPPK